MSGFAVNLKSRQINRPKIADIDRQILAEAKKISDCLISVQCEKDPYSMLSLEKLLSLTYGEKKNVFLRIKSYSRFIEKAVTSSNFFKPQQELKNFCNENLLNASEDNWEKILSSIDSSEIFEIYNHQHIQFWRTSNFWRATTYDILTVMVFEWFQIFQREMNIEANLLEKANAILNGADYIDIKQKVLIREGIVFEELCHIPQLIEANIIEAFLVKPAKLSIHNYYLVKSHGILLGQEVNTLKY
jgi:hypothetical protein